MQTIKTNTFKSTWIRNGVSVSATMVTHQLDKRRLGLRVVEMTWEDGLVEVSLIEGDGRNVNFKRHAAGVL